MDDDVRCRNAVDCGHSTSHAVDVLVTEAREICGHDDKGVAVGIPQCECSGPQWVMNPIGYSSVVSKGDIGTKTS